MHIKDKHSDQLKKKKKDSDVLYKTSQLLPKVCWHMLQYCIISPQSISINQYANQNNCVQLSNLGCIRQLQVALTIYKLSQ